jgi:hypothetical protein
LFFSCNISFCRSISAAFISASLVDAQPDSKVDMMNSMNIVRGVNGNREVGSIKTVHMLFRRLKG